MKSNKYLGLALAAGLVIASLAIPARADVKDFEFQLVLSLIHI